MAKQRVQTSSPAEDETSRRIVDYLKKNGIKVSMLLTWKNNKSDVTNLKILFLSSIPKDAGICNISDGMKRIGTNEGDLLIMAEPTGL